VINGATGEVRRAQVFVAVLGASNYTYAEARWTQSLPDWIGCHVGAFASFGGAARQIVCDNLKAGVTAASRYEPGISRSYQDMAIVDDRHDRASTIVTSQVPVELWHEHIGNPTIADAVLDRLVHGAHRLQLKGESMRKLKAAKAKLDEAAPK
jgi:hypothetical protein